MPIFREIHVRKQNAGIQIPCLTKPGDISVEELLLESYKN